MENEVMNVEVMENNEDVVNELMPVEAEVHNESEESSLSKTDMVVGGVVLGLAAAGAVALGRGLFKGGKAIIKKIKDKAAKKNEVIPPVTEEINEQPETVSIPVEDIEVKDEDDKE